MHPSTLRKKLSGVIAFPVTPFKEDLSLDLPGLHENLTKLLEHPIAAIVVAGGTGELYSLTPAEYTRVVELTALAIEDRVPVIAGVGFGQRLAVEMAQAAEKAGADGILAFPPYYAQAEDALKKSFDLSPGNLEGEKIHIWLLLGRHEFPMALEAAKALNKKVPDDVLVYGFLADANAELALLEARRRRLGQENEGTRFFPLARRVVHAARQLGARSLDGNHRHLDADRSRRDSAQSHGRARVRPERGHGGVDDPC